MGTQGSEVYERLRADVISGALRPGQRLLLDRLRERYGVGTTPLREALYRLSASLLVEAEDQRGFRVTPISLQYFNQVVEARKSFETLALRESMRLGRLEWEGGMVSAHHQLNSLPMYVDGGKTISSEWRETHLRFHLAILAGGSNLFFQHFHMIFWDHSSRCRNILQPERVREDVLREDHEQLLKAVLSRDVDLACAMLRRHITTGSAGVLHALSEMERGVRENQKIETG